MIRTLQVLAARIASLLTTKSGGTDRSQLVGMYLEHANRNGTVWTRDAANRERQNGKFAQNRRRG